MTDDPHAEHLTPATVDFARIAKVSTRSKLLDVLLVRCDVSLNIERSELADDWREKTYIAYDTHLAPHDNERFEAHAAFLALHVPGRDPDTDDLPAPDDDFVPALVLEATFELQYRLDPADPVDKEDLEHFAYVNSTMHAWPYWRELAQSMTTRMGLRPLIVRPFKIPSLYDADEEKVPSTAVEGS